MQETTIQDTFEQIYAHLVRFSDQIRVMRDTTYRVTAKLGCIPSSWADFLYYFDEGAYYHHRCQGYVESLRITNAYTFQSIDVWVNQLVYPAAENFKMAMQVLEQIKTETTISSMPEFKLLENELMVFKSLAMPIIQYANQLNQTSPPFHF